MFLVTYFAIRPNKLLGKSGDREIPLPPRSDFKVKRISESEAKSERGDFDYDIKAEFNNDGRLDIVRCQGIPKKTKNGSTRLHHEYESNVKVRIINGRTGRDLYSYSFEGFKRTNVFTRRIINHSCEIAYLENGRPSVIIGGEFMDHNNDGLFDLFVVGQHMSFYRFNMKLDSRVDVGFKFSKTVLSSPSRSGDIAGSINYVHDHIRCFSDNEWLKVKMPDN